MKRLVPILFTTETVDAIRLLIEFRRAAGISMENTFLFPSGTGENRLRGWDTLKSVTRKLELRKPKLLTPTKTRKHLATLLQLLDITDSELTWITNHMGHSKDVHLNWYRKEDATIELTKVAKVLVALDSGQGRNVQNKRIDDLLPEDPTGICIRAI